MSKGYRRFVIVGVQRTGSSAFAERLALHPHIACGWEWTESWDVVRKIRAMSAALQGNFKYLPAHKRAHIESEVSDETRWLGFRRLFGASDKWLLHPRWSAKLIVDQFGAHMSWFRSQRDLHILHIKRSNDLEWLKSKYVARVAGSFSGDAYPDDMKVTIPEKEAEARLKAKYWVDDQLARLADSNPYQQVSYEQFADDANAVVTESMQFLGCAPEGVDWERARMKQQSKKDASEYVRNIEAIQAIADRLRSPNG